MKKRLGFVSNSSSSSFVCSISGEALSGYDGEYDTKTVECTECRKEFLFEFVKFDDNVLANMSKEDVIKFYNDNYYKSDALKNAEDPSEDAIRDILRNEYTSVVNNCSAGTLYIVKQMCPICNIEHVTNEDMIKYLLAKMQYISKQQLIDEIRTTFGTYGKLQSMIKIINV